MAHFDSKLRVVSVDTLRVLCERASSTCHRFAVVSVSRSRVTIEYSNPDEYGHDRPVSFAFPCYPSHFGGTSPNVVLDCLRVVGARDSHDSEALWQAIDAAVLSHPCNGRDRRRSLTRCALRSLD